MINILLGLIYFLTITFNCCKTQEKYDYMEKYNFEIMRKVKESTGATYAVLMCNNTAIYISSISENGAFINEYPPAPNMSFVQKQFYPNGNIKSRKMYIGNNLTIDESIYYDEKGNVINKVNENEKFGKIKLDWILNLAESEGLIDLKTGRGRSELVVEPNHQGYIKEGNFILGFYKIGEYPSGNSSPLWFIQTTAFPENNFYECIYKINGDTGEILEKDCKQLYRRE